jgi:hypothetical protein
MYQFAEAASVPQIEDNPLATNEALAQLTSGRIHNFAPHIRV